MRLTVRSYRPRLDLLEGRLQPGSVLDGSLNLSLLAGDLGLLSDDLFASLEDAAVVAQPGALSETELALAAPDGGDQPRRSLGVQPLVLPQAGGEIQASEQTVAAIQNAVPLQGLQEDGGRRSNCIVNGGFETRDFTGWQVGDPLDEEVGVDDIAAHSGAFGAFMGTVDTFNTVAQTCETTAQTYTITFWLRNTKGGAPSVFLVTWGSEVLLYLENAESFEYREYIFTNVPTPDLETTLIFHELHNEDYWELDDVTAMAT